MIKVIAGFTALDGVEAHMKIVLDREAGAIVGLAAFVIALLTVIWQAIRVATANPDDAWRYE